VEKVVRDAIKKFADAGVTIREIELPHAKYALAAYYIINMSEASANLARYDGMRYGESRQEGASLLDAYLDSRGQGLGTEVKRRIILGTYALSAGYWDEYYSKAAKVRTLVKRDFEQAYQKVDVIVGPVSPTTAWNLGEKIDDPLKMYLADIYTVAANLAGIPGLSVPCGFSDGLPVGLQILGKQWDEETILRVGYAYEQATDWKKEKPKI